MNAQQWTRLKMYAQILFGINEEQVRTELAQAGLTPSTTSGAEAIAVLNMNHKGKLEEIQKALRESGLQ